MIFTFRETQTNDRTYSLWPLIVCTQIVQCTSITTACVPYLQPFLLSLESGMLKNDELGHQSTKYTHTSSASRSKPLSNSEATQDILAQRSSIALLPQLTAGEPSQGQLRDNRRASSQFEFISCVTPTHIAVDTRRRELEGY